MNPHRNPTHEHVAHPPLVEQVEQPGNGGHELVKIHGGKLFPVSRIEDDAVAKDLAYVDRWVKHGVFRATIVTSEL